MERTVLPVMPSNAARTKNFISAPVRRELGDLLKAQSERERRPMAGVIDYAIRFYLESDEAKAYREVGS